MYVKCHKLLCKRESKNNIAFKLKIILLVHFLNTIIIECMKSCNKDITEYIYKGTESSIKKSATKSYFFNYKWIFGKFIFTDII